MEINSKDELLKVIMDLQGQVENMQQVIDTMNPVEEEPPEEPKEEPEEEKEDIDEIDKMLHEE